MRTRWVLLALLVCALLLALTGCTGADPCRQVADEAPPEAAALMEQGYEVSKEVHEDLECELQPSGAWERDA